MTATYGGGTAASFGRTSADVDTQILVADDGSITLSPIAGEENIGTSNAVLRTRRRVNATKLTPITAVTIEQFYTGLTNPRD
jgi:hypothetical protein